MACPCSLFVVVVSESTEVVCVRVCVCKLSSESTLKIEVI